MPALQKEPAKAYEVKTLLEWNAPGHPFKKRTKSFYTSSLLIAFLLEIILVLFSQYMLMLVVASVVFFAFAMASVPPQPFHYKITTEGVMVEDHFYLWQELYDFYFKAQSNTDIVHIRTHVLIPGEILLMPGSVSKDQIKTILAKYLPYREYVKPTFMEKSGDWLSKNFPLERPEVSGKRI